ncbi:uncharacterized protein LOC144437788 [Glandiceps talaboti]
MPLLRTISVHLLCILLALPRVQVQPTKKCPSGTFVRLGDCHPCKVCRKLEDDRCKLDCPIESQKNLETAESTASINTMAPAGPSVKNSDTAKHVQLPPDTNLQASHDSDTGVIDAKSNVYLFVSILVSFLALLIAAMVIVFAVRRRRKTNRGHYNPEVVCSAGQKKKLRVVLNKGGTLDSHIVQEEENEPGTPPDNHDFIEEDIKYNNEQRKTKV